MKIEPRNQMAQVLHRARGNPATTLPNTAISNCFPGLEYDFKQFWRRTFIGIVLEEWDNYVVNVEDPMFEGLKRHRLLKVDGREVLANVSGPVTPGGGDDGLVISADAGVVTMEWSNSLAFVLQRQGQKVKCVFTADIQDKPIAVPSDNRQTIEVELTIRRMLENSVAPSREALRPGELTQGLCSPWQHDYRECACYYWPATRPDYVNVEAGTDGVSHGDNWMSKERSGDYVLDDRIDGRMISYEELFKEWERLLKFQVKGRDAQEG
jgi:hypothetical protein